jgi:hypothetical protein
VSLISRKSALAWDLRGFLWSGKEVVVLAPDADIPRLRGIVIGVAPTDSIAWLDDARWDEPVTVDLGAVASVRQPHYHEEGDPPERTREVFPIHRGPEPMPGQMHFGAERIPEVSRRSLISMQRAAGMLLPQEDIDALAALDRVAKGKPSVPTIDVADELGESIQRTVRRLRFLAGLKLVSFEEGRRYRWSPGD